MKPATKMVALSVALVPVSGFTARACSYASSLPHPDRAPYYFDNAAGWAAAFVLTLWFCIVWAYRYK